MSLLLAVLALIHVAYRLRARPPAQLEGGVNLDTVDLCLEYSDEELACWGLSRGQMRALELRHFEESAHDHRGPDDGGRMRPLRPPHRFPLGRRGTPRVHRPMRRSSYSRRAPRR